MIRNTFFRTVSFLLVTVGLVSCGGGKSSSGSIQGQVPFSLIATHDGAGSHYRGLTTAANLSPETSFSFLEGLFGFRSDSSSNLNRITSLIHSGKLAKDSSITTLNRAVSDSRNGQLSGTYKLTGDINDRGQGVVVYEWENFSDVVGEVIDGKSILNVIAYDIQRDFITKSTTNMVDLSITEKGRTIVSNGFIVEEVDISAGKVTTLFDMAFYNQNTNSWKAYDKLKKVQYAASLPVKEEITGRLYLQDLGYIDISTPTALTECTNCEPQHPINQGVLRFEDSHNNIATFSFVDHLKFNFKFVDASQVETKRNADWREMDSWVFLNRPPYQPHISFEAYPTTNTDVVVNINNNSFSDEDGDEVSHVITWKINGEAVEGNTSKTLKHTQYNALDTIEVSVVAVDSYGGRSLATVSTATVPNTAPTIIVNDAVFTIGDTLTLDASNTTDEDGQTLVFKWTLSDTHLPEDLITIVDSDKATTEIKVPASGTYLFVVEVKEQNANGELIEGSFNIQNVSLTVRPEDIYHASEALPGFVGFSGALSVADVTGDGYNDVILSQFGQLVIKNFANNTLQSVSLNDSNYRPHTILTEDMNNDGLNDFIIDQKKGFLVTKQPSNRDFGIFPSQHTSQTPFNNTVNQIQTGHFNNDRLLDVALLFNTSIEIFLQKEPSTEPPFEDEILPPEDDTVFETPVVYNFSNNTGLTPFQSTQMRVDDVTGDSLDDIVIITPLDNNNYRSLVLFKQKSAGGFETKKIIHPDIHYTEGDALALVDLNGDQRIDIVATHSSIENASHAGGLNIYYQSSTGTFDQLEQRVTEAFSNRILVKDINNDGNSDLIINNGERFTIHKQKADKHLSPLWSVYDFVNRVSTFDIGDINADGKLDIVTETEGLIQVRYGK